MVAWKIRKIATIQKAGGYQRFQLFDLEKDPSQKTEVPRQHPEVFARLKKQLMSIMRKRQTGQNNRS